MICYFSGTGNSEYVAKRLASALNEPITALKEWIGCEQEKTFPEANSYTIVSPVYAWRLPRFLEDLLPKLGLKKGSTIRLVLTCGDSIGAACVYFKQLAEKMGLVYSGTFKVIMPENYIALYDAPTDKASKKIVQDAEPVIDEIIECIKNGTKSLDTYTGRDQRKSSIVNKAFYKMIVSDKKFTADEHCIGCGLCVKNCPFGNITLENGKPVWHGHCTHCMACICYCPSEAIQHGDKTKDRVHYHFKEEYTK